MAYKNFDVAMFFTCFDLNLCKNDIDKFEEAMNFFEKHISIDKVYLETYRAGMYFSIEDMTFFKNYFMQKGIKVSGAITTVAKGENAWDFRSFCYSSVSQRNELINVVRNTAQLFDEVILDDFFFTNCKCDLCISNKSTSGWSNFRTNQLGDFSKLLVAEAKSVNPTVKMIIKYPNWYDYHQSTGYSIKRQINIFDSVYTGTETRDPKTTQQNLQRYIGYFIMRYIDSIAGDNNLGGWFDSFDCKYNLNSFVEQINLTAFAKAKEITLFCAGSLANDSRIFVPLAGFVFSELDKVLPLLGKPLGIDCYKPFDSSGEDYIHGYLGMLGLPLQPCAEYPVDSELILLTKSAAYDKVLIPKIKTSLSKGASVYITSGLLEALGESINTIAEIKYSCRKFSSNYFATEMKDCAFLDYQYGATSILLPQIEFSTNDSWQIAVAIGENSSCPVLLQSKYSSGKLFVLTIPDKFEDLYNYPMNVLNILRRNICSKLPVHIEGASNIGLFMYDNNTFILESFLRANTTVTVAIHRENIHLKDLTINKTYSGFTKNGTTYIDIPLAPSSFTCLCIL